MRERGLLLRRLGCRGHGRGAEEDTGVDVPKKICFICIVGHSQALGILELRAKTR